MRGLCQAIVLVALLAQAAGAEETAEYRSYLRNTERSLAGLIISGGLKPLALVVTIIEGEDRDRGRFGEDRRVLYGCRISEEGQIASFQHTERGSKGSGAPFLAADDWKRLQALIAKLPDDRGALPPINRRLIVQVKEGEGWKSRVYDRANAPDEILEVLRLTACGFRAWVHEHKPVREVEVHAGHRDGFLCLAPDGKSLLSGRDEELKFVGVEDLKIEKTLELPPGLSLSNTCILSPDGTQAVIAGLGGVMILGTKKWEVQRLIEEPYVADRQAILTAPHFAARGAHLLLHSGLPQLVVVNSETGERLAPGATGRPRQCVSRLRKEPLLECRHVPADQSPSPKQKSTDLPSDGFKHRSPGIFFGRRSKREQPLQKHWRRRQRHRVDRPPLLRKRALPRHRRALSASAFETAAPCGAAENPAPT